MRSDKLNVNSANYGDLSDDQLTQLTPEILFQWNYISCGAPVISAMSKGAAGVTATGAIANAIFPGPENQMYLGQMCRIGAFTAAGYPPQIGGTVPETDTASTAAGLNLQLDHDETDNAGLELGCGPPYGSNGSKFTVGTHRGYIDATFFSAAWNDYDAVTIGFRKAEDYEVTHAPLLGGAANGDGVYTDFACLGLMGTADKVSHMTTVNDDTSTWTDSTETATDSQNHRFRIYLDGTGNVTYSHIGNAVAGAGTLAAPAATAAFAFDDGDTLIPYVTWHGAGHDDIPLYLKDIKIVRAPGVSYSGDGSI